MDWSRTEIANIKELDFDLSFSLAKYVSKQYLINENIANKIIIKVLDIWDNVNPSTKELWVDIIESAGF